MFGALFISKITAPVFGAAGGCDNSFFGLPSWWKYIENQPSPPDCAINFNFPDDIWAVGLAVTGMLLYIAGIAAVVSIIIAGVAYITSGGDAQKAASARRRIINSLIGLAIAVVASVLVTFLGSTIGG